MPERIGEMNGKWSILLKIGLAFTPWVLTALLSLQVYLVARLHTLETWAAATEANRFTSKDWIRERRDLMAELPPKWVTNQLTAIEARMNRIEGKLDRLVDEGR